MNLLKKSLLAIENLYKNKKSKKRIKKYFKMIHTRDAALPRRNVRDTRVRDTATATATTAATAI